MFLLFSLCFQLLVICITTNCLLYQPDTFNRKLGLNLPFKFIYGIAVLLLIFIDKMFSQYHIIIKTLIATIIIAFYECISGLISFYFNGYQTWDYSQTFYPLCRNYISIEISACWSVLIFFFFFLYDHFKIKS